MNVLAQIGDGLWNAFRMFWEVWWALVLGFLLSGIVQAWVPREPLERALGDRGPRALALSTGLGAASSSCSYAAVAIAKSLFQKGASLASAMAFQFASTNLVFEIGIVIWLFLGWQFTLAEFAGGLLLIVLMWIGVKLLVPRHEEEQARAHAQAADSGHVHPTAGGSRILSLDSWTDVARNFRGDWVMLWREITLGFLIAGFVALLPMDFFNSLFLTDRGGALQLIENVIVGPLVAVLSFVCSVGNIPLAAVLWAGGISFSGVIAFVYADLIIIPLVLIYGRYYGWRIAAVIVSLMFGAMVVAALAIDGLFSAAGLIPQDRPSIDSITEREITWNYTAVLNIVFTLVAVALFALTLRRGARDPVCGMSVDRGRALSLEHDGKRYYFCGPGCRDRFAADPERYASGSPPPAEHAHAHHH
ncbi:MAG TPA: permease [Gaiellaceae bacterium]|nr:permease [Gaiellaceae bacterium]